MAVLSNYNYLQFTTYILQKKTSWLLQLKGTLEFKVQGRLLLFLVTYLAFVWVAFRGLGTRRNPRWWRDHLDSPLSASQIGKSKAELTNMTPLKTNILLMEEIRLYRPGIDGNVEVFMGTFFKLPAGWSAQKSGQHGVWHSSSVDITDSTKFCFDNRILFLEGSRLKYYIKLQWVFHQQTREFTNT